MVVGAFFVISGYVAAYTTTELGQCLEGKPPANTACRWWTKMKSGYKTQIWGCYSATGIISFRQTISFGKLRRFLLGNWGERAPKDWTMRCLGQGIRPALWVFWIPQGCTKMMLHIIKGIETRHPPGKLSWKWTLYQTLSCTSWVSFQVEKASNNWMLLRKQNQQFLISLQYSFRFYFLTRFYFCFPSHSTYLLNLPFPCFIYDDTFIVHWCSMSPLGRMAQTLGSKILRAATEGWVCDHPHHGTLATTHHCAVDFLAHAPCPKRIKSVWPCEDFDSLKKGQHTKPDQ